MDTELREFLRLSPYQLSHILKHEPNVLLSDSHIRSHLAVHVPKTKLAFSLVQPNPQPFQQQHCYFCKAASTANCPWSGCGDCRKVVCPSCLFRCSKCEKVLCQFDKSYDYALECVCCFNC